MSFKVLSTNETSCEPTSCPTRSSKTSLHKANAVPAPRRPSTPKVYHFGFHVLPIIPWLKARSSANRGRITDDTFSPRVAKKSSLHSLEEQAMTVRSVAYRILANWPDDSPNSSLAACNVWDCQRVTREVFQKYHQGAAFPGGIGMARHVHPAAHIGDIASRFSMLSCATTGTPGSRRS